MFTLKYIRETEKTHSYTNMYMNGIEIGYIIKNDSPNVNRFTQYVFTSTTENVPTFYYETKKGLINLVKRIFQGEQMQVRLGFNLKTLVNLDMFEFNKLLPKDVKDVIEELDNSDYTYADCNALVSKLEGIGWTCDYDLSGTPYDLQKIKE